MNGAPAEPWVKTTSRPSRASMRPSGPSHHFLRTRMNAHSSARIPTFSFVPSNAISRLLIQLVQAPPVDVLAERRRLLFCEHVGPEDEGGPGRPHAAQVRGVG